MGIRMQSRARKVSTWGVRWPTMLVVWNESLKKVRRTSKQSMVQHGMVAYEWVKDGVRTGDAACHGVSESRGINAPMAWDVRAQRVRRFPPLSSWDRWFQLKLCSGK